MAVNVVFKIAPEPKSVTVKENNAIFVEQKNKVLGYVGTPTKIDSKLILNIIKENFIHVGISSYMYKCTSKLGDRVTCYRSSLTNGKTYMYMYQNHMPYATKF